MQRKQTYLLLAIIGCLGPYYFFVSFLLKYGLNASAFVQQLFGSPISAFFASDLLLSCVVFLIFLRHEARRYGMSDQWLYLLTLVMVGLSLALPLFLYRRENRLDVGPESQS